MWLVFCKEMVVFLAMSCCCASLGHCSQGMHKVPQSRLVDLAARLGQDLPEGSFWCHMHWKFITITLRVTCVACKQVKPRGSLRVAKSGLVGDRICTACLSFPRIDLGPTVASVIKKPYFIMPVESKWYSMIITGAKSYKFFSRRLGKQSIGRLVLMRACTPDGKSRMVIGAVILGELDPDAPRDPKMGYGAYGIYGYPIVCYVPFSRFRCFACKTIAGGIPKLVSDVDVLANARRALEVCYGSRFDE